VKLALAHFTDSSPGVRCCATIRRKALRFSAV
jgi:hypothetical protein